MPVTREHVHSNACDDHDADRAMDWPTEHRVHCSCFTDVERLRRECNIWKIRAQIAETKLDTREK